MTLGRARQHHGDRYDHHEHPQRTRPSDPARRGGRRPQLQLGTEPDLLFDDRNCTDQYAAHNLVRAGFIAAATLSLVGQRVAATLTPAGQEALGRYAMAA